jgi:hypothetical protein
MDVNLYLTFVILFFPVVQNTTTHGPLAVTRRLPPQG